MNRTAASIVLTIGIVLLIAGLRSSHSAMSQFSEVMNGHPSRDTMALIGAGIAAIILGGSSLRKRSGKP